MHEIKAHDEAGSSPRFASSKKAPFVGIAVPPPTQDILFLTPRSPKSVAYFAQLKKMRTKKKSLSCCKTSRTNHAPLHCECGLSEFSFKLHLLI